MIPIQIDPPDHTTYRGIINPLFSPKRMRDREPQIRDIATELLDEMLTEKKVDFIEAFAREFPSRVFLALMGWDLADAPKLNEWTDIMVLGKHGASEAEHEAVREGAVMEVYAYFAVRIAERMEKPTEPETQNKT